MKLVLIVDDEQDLTELISFQLKNLNLKTLESHSGHDAWEIFQRSPGIDLVISDVRMPDGDGVELLKKIKIHSPDTKILLMSGFMDVTEKEAIALGAEGLMRRPMTLRDVENWIRKIYPDL